jgi:hypothetical protein
MDGGSTFFFMNKAHTYFYMNFDWKIKQQYFNYILRN